MYNNIDGVRRRIKHKKAQSFSKLAIPRVDFSNENMMKKGTNFVFRVMLATILFLGVSIGIRANASVKDNFYNFLYKTNLNFADYNKVITNFLGSVLPFDTFLDKDPKPVSKDIPVNEVVAFKDGFNFTVDKNSPALAFDIGIVTFIGEKGDYGNVIVVEQSNGVEVWYGNVANSQLKMYDYVAKGDVVGEVNGDTLFVAFMKDKKFIDYSEYLQLTDTAE